MITIDDIRQARERLRGQIYCTPLARSESLSRLAGKDLWLKLENLQMTGSFKERGALNRLVQLTPAERQRGVIAASAGNHAQAVAYIAGKLGVHATIIMPETTALIKLRNTKNFGAEVILFGQNFGEAYAQAEKQAVERGMVFVSAYDDPHIVAGQGTIGLELLEQEPELEAVVVPVGGGGLIAGIALAVKTLKPSIKVIGVEVEGFQTAKLSLEQNRIVPAGDQPSLADGIAVKTLGKLPFEILKQHVDQLVTVNEEEVASAVLTLLEVEKTVGEGAAAAALAAVLEHKFWLKERRLAVILSGGNIDVNMLSRIIERGLARDGRRLRLMVQVPDRPGNLARVATLIAECRANVLDVNHERAFLKGPVGATGIAFTVETRDRGHADELLARLTAAGYHPRLAE